MFSGFSSFLCLCGRDFLRKPALRVFLGSCLLFPGFFLLPSAAQAQQPHCSPVFDLTGLQVVPYRGDGSASLGISWDSLPLRYLKGLSSYIVRWETSGSPASQVDVGTATSYSLGNLPWDTEYTVSVRVEGRAGQGCWSTKRATTPSSDTPSSDTPSSDSPSPASQTPVLLPTGSLASIIDCPDHDAPATTAGDVESARNPQTLADFVKEARKGVETLLDGETDKVQAMLKLVGCFGTEGDWNSGSVYLFAIADDGQYFLAPEDSGLAGTYLDLEDGNGCDVAAEIARAAKDEPLQCDSLGLVEGTTPPDEQNAGYVEYLWDNPADPDDGEAPGNSRKLSYVEGIKFDGLLPGKLFILGSGYYPDWKVPEGPSATTDSGGGGCALVRGTDSGNGQLARLLLAALALASAACLGRGVFHRRGRNGR